MTRDYAIRQLQGPVLVLGASGFVGANLLRMLLSVRDDAYGIASRLPAWRLAGLPPANVREADLLVDSNVDALLDAVKPKTIFDCVAYGAYSFETDSSLIYRTNFSYLSGLLRRLESRKIARYIHAGSSSEYGDNSAAPSERDFPAPNSDYAVSKIAAANLLHYYGKKRGFPCANLRLYSVYGPMEDSSRLIPALVGAGLERRYPELVDPQTARDFVYVDDACEAFIAAAAGLQPAQFGDSFNVGSGRQVRIGELASIARNLFGIAAEPSFSMPGRSWDLQEWYANVEKISSELGWRAETPIEEGLRLTADWYSALEDKERYRRSSKKFGPDSKHSVSAIVACYKDGQAIPIMYKRLREAFTGLNIDYEIIFVNDASPDDSEQAILALSRLDRRVKGVTHSRNFGSQAAFRSGMALSTMNACVLLDGDLQDPPELIAEFVGKWREGYDVVYGRRVKREAAWFMQVAYKAFYRVFDAFSYVSVPRDAGDFSLMDRKVVDAVLRFPERDLFLRGVRAFAGFRQTGVDYVRPERMFGRSTNNLWKNVGWAKKGILSFSYVPLNVLSAFAAVLLALSAFGILGQTTARLLFPSLAPRGVTTVLALVVFFGSLNLFAISLIGEYIAKIFEEVKRRPHFLRRSVIVDGEIRSASGLSERESAT